MRKVFISFENSPAVEKNANEYSVYPKTNTFGAYYDGNSITAAFTSGKGKSAVPNYYLYFRDEKGAIFYFRSSPSEIESAKKGFAIFSVEPAKLVEAAKALEAAEESPDSGEAPPEGEPDLPAELTEAAPLPRKARRRVRASA
jgi:hypothetical protein